MPPVFRILGALEVWSDEQRVPIVGIRHQRVLVMLLLSENRVVPLDRLVEAAWDDEPPATAARQVRKIVANLRRHIPGGAGLIVTDDPGYRMALTADQLDLSRFNAAVAKAKEADPADARSELRDALALWRGPVLAGHGGRVIDAVSAGLDERRLSATERLLELRLDLGEGREVIEELRELAQQQPLRERPRGMLMVALYRSGRQADALAEYDRLRHDLADELGIDPGRELVALHERILRNDPGLDPPEPPAAPAVTAVPAAPAAPSPQALPHDLPDFVGRSAELRRLRDAVTRPANPARILNINGMGGTGKTSLAVHAAHSLAADYPDGQLFVELHGFTSGRRPVDPALALDTLLTGIGMPHDRIPESLAGRISLWRTATATRRMLVVLDNAIDSAQVEPLLPGAHENLTLITSRSYLAGLDGAVPLSLGLLGETDSLDLLAGTLGLDRLVAEPEAARRLVRHCGRLPLALRIVAARLHNRPHWSMEHLVERLLDADGNLGELVAEHRSVATTIGLSYDAMRPEQRNLFQQLGMVPVCDFDAYVAAAIAGRPRGETLDLLESLLDARLLEPLGSTRYTLHDLVRGYAQGLAADARPPQLLNTRRRVLEYYIRVAGTAAALLVPGRAHPPADLSHPPADTPPIRDAVGALDWFDAERANLLGAVTAARRGGLHWHARRLATELSHYLKLRGSYEEEQNEVLRATAHTPVN
jgi:DNA-binding SARP family transcriptional activator